MRLPVSLRVAKNGPRLRRRQAIMKCGRASAPLRRLHAVGTVKPDGTFGRSERYTIRYTAHRAATA